MAKARMLHNKISRSLVIDKLPLPVQLLFSWMIPHADDEGKLRGEPKYIKATVVPLKKWSVKKIGDYLKLIKDENLIHHWEQNGEWYIQFVKWNEHQTIRKDRFKSSDLPSYSEDSDNHSSTNGQPDDNQESPQSNVIKSNLTENNSADNVEKVERRKKRIKESQRMARELASKKDINGQ